MIRKDFPPGMIRFKDGERLLGHKISLLAPLFLSYFCRVMAGRAEIEKVRQKTLEFQEAFQVWFGNRIHGGMQATPYSIKGELQYLLLFISFLFICPKTLNPFYVLSYNIYLVKTLWTFGRGSISVSSPRGYRIESLKIH